MSLKLQWVAVYLTALLCGCATKLQPVKSTVHVIDKSPMNSRLIPGDIQGQALTLLAKGKSTPFNWGYRILDSSGITIRWHEKISTDSFPFANFRISTATDIREPCVLEITLAESGVKLGEIEVSYGTYLQVYELVLRKSDLQNVIDQGVRIRQISGGQPAGIFSSRDKNISEIFRPHLLMYGTKVPGPDEIKRMILYGEVYQPFGWMEGVVMDGLQVLSAHEPNSVQSLQRRFNQYFTASSFSYTGLFNTPVFNTIMNVETILPFALYARYHPSHPSLERAIDFCRQHQDSSGVISDDPSAAYPVIKTEECYTVSYPLAVVGRQREQEELLNLAVRNLMARAAALADTTGIYQRTNNTGGREYKNWSRGVAWYLLGFVRSWEQLKYHADADKVKKEFIRAVTYVMQFQQEDGMWYCFMHEPETGIETSGTAGIAAALKYAHQIGIMDEKAAIAAGKATAGLMKYITPDGLLKGTSQINRGGEKLQRGGFRIISPYTLGFMGYLISAGIPVKSQK